MLNDAFRYVKELKAKLFYFKCEIMTLKEVSPEIEVG
jgi:hypothetical protein